MVVEIKKGTYHKVPFFCERFFRHSVIRGFCKKRKYILNTSLKNWDDYNNLCVSVLLHVAKFIADLI